MKILVTGGAGFIGSHFIKQVIASNYKVVNLDKLTYAGNLENLREIEDNPNYEFVRGDIAENSIVNHIVKDVDAIVNFAAESHVDRSIDNANIFISSNVTGTLNLLEAARKHDKKFLHVGTDEVYGHILDGSFSEESNLNPRNPYSASKAAADLLVKSYFTTYGLDVKITRSSNNFGPNQYPEKFIPLFTINALQNKNLPLYGDGRQIRDWTYVKDNCKAIEVVMNKGKSGEIYNISAQNEKENIEVAKMILSHLNKPESLIQHVKDRPGHDRRYSITNDKVKALGWKPEHDFESAIKETVDWYKNNENWWKPLIL